jgi:hypothetical protein
MRGERARLDPLVVLANDGFRVFVWTAAASVSCRTVSEAWPFRVAVVRISPEARDELVAAAPLVSRRRLA